MSVTLAALLLLSAVAIDGDTLALETGEKVRVMGVDTPEKHPLAKCEAEHERAMQATRRTAELIAGGVSLERHRLDIYKRTLAVVRLPDGRDLAAVLISEKLGREYHGERRRSWCG